MRCISNNSLLVFSRPACGTILPSLLRWLNSNCFCVIYFGTAIHFFKTFDSPSGSQNAKRSVFENAFVPRTRTATAVIDCWADNLMSLNTFSLYFLNWLKFGLLSIIKTSFRAQASLVSVVEPQFTVAASVCVSAKQESSCGLSDSFLASRSARSGAKNGRAYKWMASLQVFWYNEYKPDTSSNKSGNQCRVSVPLVRC